MSRSMNAMGEFARHIILRGAVLWVAVLAMPPMVAASAQEGDARAALQALFREAPAAESRFAPSFLDQVPIGRVRQIVADLQRRYGPLRGVREQGGRVLVELERADVPARITLDARQRITGLLFEAPVATGKNVQELVAAIAGLPGRTSILVTTNGAVRAAHQPDLPLAVGSAAKLAILKAAKQAVAEGRLAWDRVVPVDPAWRSLPSGILQDWPEDTPVTVATLATLAISISDNTAADALLQLVGRSAVEAVSPRNAPFLSTRELLTLKHRGEGELRRAWIAGDPRARRALLDTIRQRPLPRPADLETTPILDVEWFLSATELCALLEAEDDLGALHANPGLAERAAWRSIAYKGGSEPGVLNASTRVVAADGTVHCVAASWNDRERLDGERLTAPYRAILRALRTGAP